MASSCLVQSRVTLILRVFDPERARQYYESTLGLPYVGRSGDGKHLFRLAGGGTLALLQSDAPPGKNTVLSFEVDDVSKTIRDLQGRGVKFEDYDLPDFKTVDHVCVLGSEKAAWFSDPEGNLLCVHQQLG